MPKTQTTVEAPCDSNVESTFAKSRSAKGLDYDINNHCVIPTIYSSKQRTKSRIFFERYIVLLTVDLILQCSGLCDVYYGFMYRLHLGFVRE